MAEVKPSSGWLRALKVFVIFGFPLLGFVYFYQFTGQARDFAVPFHTFRAPPETTVQNFKGEMVKLPLKEPVTLVNYWATWCPPCVEEFPAMVELQRQLEGQGAEILFVSVDESWDQVKKFMATYGVQVAENRLFWDPQKAAALTWGSEKFPETYVVRRDGWVVEKIIGAQQWTHPRVLKYVTDLVAKFSSIPLDGGHESR